MFDKIQSRFFLIVQRFLNSHKTGSGIREYPKTTIVMNRQQRGNSQKRITLFRPGLCRVRFNGSNVGSRVAAYDSIGVAGVWGVIPDSIVRFASEWFHHLILTSFQAMPPGSMACLPRILQPVNFR